jgi:hypothetical protein
VQHNEALSVSTFLKGINVYEAIIPALADAPSSLEANAAAAYAAKQAANRRCHDVTPASAAPGAALGRAADADAPAAKRSKGDESE